MTLRANVVGKDADRSGAPDPPLGRSGTGRADFQGSRPSIGCFLRGVRAGVGCVGTAPGSPRSAGLGSARAKVDLQNSATAKFQRQPTSQAVGIRCPWRRACDSRPTIARVFRWHVGGATIAVLPQSACPTPDAGQRDTTPKFICAMPYASQYRNLSKREGCTPSSRSGQTWLLQTHLLR